MSAPDFVRIFAFTTWSIWPLGPADMWSVTSYAVGANPRIPFCGHGNPGRRMCALYTRYIRPRP